MKTDWYQLFLILTFVLSVALYKSLKKFKISGIVLLMFLVSATEFIAGNLSVFGWTNNQFLYNYYLFYSTALSFYIFYQMLGYKHLIKYIYVTAGILCVGFIFFNWEFIQGKLIFNTYSLIVSQFVSIILSMLVISKLFMDEDISINLIDNPYFWISGGTLIFSFGTIVVLGLQQFIALKGIQINGKNIYRIIMPVLSALLYLSYCYSFILCKKLTNRLSPS